MNNKKKFYIFYFTLINIINVPMIILFKEKYNRKKIYKAFYNITLLL